MMGEANSQCQLHHTPFVIACSCVFLVSHLPQIPREFPSPRESAVIVDSMALVL